MTSLGRLLRRRLITGLIVIAPVGVTLYILYLLFRTVDGILGNVLYNLIGFPIPGLGLLLLLALLLGVGWLAEETLGSQIAGWWNQFLDRIPLVSRLYGATRRIIGSVFGGEEKRFFKSVVLFQYPSPGNWTLGFETGTAPPALADRVEKGITIFLPTSPNPVTGFLIIVPEADAIRLPVTVEEGFTYILSAGAVPPAGVHSAGTSAAVSEWMQATDAAPAPPGSPSSPGPGSVPSPGSAGPRGGGGDA